MTIFYCLLVDLERICNSRINYEDIRSWKMKTFENGECWTFYNIFGADLLIPNQPKNIPAKINMVMARHPIHFKPIIGLGVKRYFHLRDTLNFICGGILKLHIVNLCPLWCVFQCIILTKRKYALKKNSDLLTQLRNLWYRQRDNSAWTRETKRNIQKTGLNRKQLKI